MCLVKIDFSAKLDTKKHIFIKETKVISFEANYKHIWFHSIFLLYLSWPFLKSVLYEVIEILSICVTQEITEKIAKFPQDWYKL